MRKDGKWSEAAILEAGCADEVLWPGPIPLFAICSFSAASEDDRLHLFALAKGFSNITPPQQTMEIENIQPLPLDGDGPTVEYLPVPSDWNALRGAAAMAAWSVPAVGPWLDVLCSALNSERDDSAAHHVGATWWAEPPWRKDSNPATDDPQLILWRSILCEITKVNFREKWQPLSILESIKGRVQERVSPRWMDEFVRETRALLHDERRVDVDRGRTDPVGLALQLVLLRPTPERFVSWKDELRALSPGVWWTGATLSGLLRGFSDLQPRFRGLAEGRRILAMQTWQLASSFSIHARKVYWPGLVESGPSWRHSDGRIQFTWDHQVWGERTESSRGKWFSTDLKDPIHRRHAVMIARQLNRRAIDQRIIVADSRIEIGGDGEVHLSRSGKEIAVLGEISLALPHGARIVEDLNDAEFRAWLLIAGIPVRLPDPGPPGHANSRESLPSASSAGANSNGERDFRQVQQEPDNGPTLEPQTIQGLHVICDFVNEHEEMELVREIDSAPWTLELTRRVQHYGWRYDYKARRVDPSAWLGPLPPWAGRLADRLLQRGMIDERPDQVIVNEYIRAQGISKHIDCVPCFRGSIITISLCESWEMIFRGPRQQKIARALPRRSATIIGGEARHDWTHEIPKRNSESWGLRERRISVTFRKVILPSDEPQGKSGHREDGQPQPQPRRSPERRSRRTKNS